MEERKNIKVSLFSVVLMIIIFVLIVGIIYIFLENQKLNKQIIGYDNTSTTNNQLPNAMAETNTLVNQLNAQLSEKDKTIDELEKEINELKNANSKNSGSNSTNTYELGTIKNISDVISDNDTKLAKAQKIAKEVMTAVSSKDWYYLAKLVGTDADYFIKYGIYNYTIDVNDYKEIDGEYIFNETYETTSPVNEALGKLLIIKFEDGGKIIIDPNCTGI